MKKVLIALDFDVSAQKVAEEGYSLAKILGAEITLLHVVTDPVYYTLVQHVTIMGFSGITEIGGEIPKDTPELKALSLKFLNKSKLHLNDNSIQTLVKEGDCATAILESALEIKADLIIMGSHSRSELNRKMPDSITKKILTEAKCPVLIIPTKENASR